MNKDLNDRLIPNGEYRDGLNISVGKSESDDIGALETVLGNVEITATNLALTPSLAADMKVIGYITNENKSIVYVFATNYTDVTGPLYETGPNKIPSDKRCIIYSWDLSNETAITILVDNIFLNFSTTNPIQASIIEDLLFFTDNRNQPRKINTTQTSGTYYTNESQISVAKYSPYEAISLVKKTNGTVLASPAPTATTFSVVANSAILVGMSVSSVNLLDVAKIDGGEYLIVSAVSTTGNVTSVTLSNAPTLVGNNPATGDKFLFLMSTMSDKSWDTTWPGDPDYLEDRYIRFSYRFQYDDGEYSLMAPFTQIAYLPKQKGYFFGDGIIVAPSTIPAPSDENSTYRSTVVEFMENSVNNVELIVPLPEAFANNTTITSEYKIKNIEILYKESDALIVKVLDTLTVSDVFNLSSGNNFTYDYQSRKPYKTLTEEQTVRVYDKVPVRALAQETAGSRIIYGNYTDRYTPPNDLNYEVKVVDKNTTIFNNWVEYPNHTLKQNRNYQVGFVLSDKYGRQSPVILSPVASQITIDYSGSTIYSPYNSGTSNIKEWFGDALQLTINDKITSDQTELPNFQTGRPGLYAVRRNDGFNVFGGTPIVNGLIYTFTPTALTVANIPQLGDYLRGEHKDFVKVSVAPTVDGFGVYTVTCNEAINKAIYEATEPFAPDMKYAYALNETGWYSYKVVVKQTEQDYYNVYLPGILNGYPQREVTVPSPNPFNIPSPVFPTGEVNKTANIVLINDNINKIPRDLSEVGPDQKQFRSSVQLFGRVNNTTTSNVQYFPGISTDTAISISTADDSNMVYQTLSTAGQGNLYQLDSNPLIARLSTNSSNPIGVVTATMEPYLAVYETEPVESLLDIFWETATEGLIADLNSDIDNGFVGASTFTATGWSLNENETDGDIATNPFWPVSQEGNPFNSPGAYSYIGATQPTSGAVPFVDAVSGLVNWSVISSSSLNSLTNLDGTSKFVLEYLDGNAVANKYSYQIKLNLPTLADRFIYQNGSINEVYTFTFNIKTVIAAATPIAATLTTIGDLTNITPNITLTLPTIYRDVSQGATAATPFIDYSTNDATTGTTTPGVNGSSNTSGNKTDLFYSVTGSSFFSISSTGALFQTGGNESTPYGTYNLVIKLQDATDALGQTLGGEISITRNQTVVIGPQPVNSGVESTCISTAVPTPSFATSPQTGSNPPNQFTTPNPNDSTYYNSPISGNGKTVTGVWYISSNTYTGYGTLTGQINNGLAANDQIPVSTFPLAKENSTRPWKLGTALTGGTVAFSCNMAQNNATTQIPGKQVMPQLESTAQFKVFHRLVDATPQPWVQIPDINNNILLAPNKSVPASRTPFVISTGNLGMNGSPFTSYAQIVFAFDEPGEYAIMFDEGSTETGDEDNQRMVAWCNSSDLHYSKCVVEGGTQTTLGNASNNYTYPYTYGVGNNPGSSQSTCLWGTNSVWSPIPYGEYVTQFFSNTTFTDTWTMIGPDTITNENYYGFKGLSVYTDSSLNNYFAYSARFTAADGKKYPTTGGTSCYALYCTTGGTISTSCNPVIRLFPYALNA